MREKLYSIGGDGKLRRAPSAEMTKDGRLVPLDAEAQRALGFRPLADERPQPPPGGSVEFVRYEWRDAQDAPVRSPRLRDHVAAVYRVVAPPRTFVTADLVEQLMAAGVWEAARAWIVKRGMLDLVLATKEFDEENENFKAGRAALQQALGWSDEDVEELLAKCVKEGV